MEQEKNSGSQNLYRKLKAFFAAVSVEPVALCYMFPAHILFTATQNFNLEKACRVNLNYTTSVCDALVLRNKSGYTVAEEQKVQALVASVNSYSTALQGFMVCILLLMIGSWSDKNCKRKPLMIVPLMGDTTTVLLLLLSLALYNELPVEFNAFAEAVPQGLAGGGYCLITATLAHIAEEKDIEKRTMKIGAINVIIPVAIYAGYASGGVLFNLIKLYQIYLIIIVIHLFGIAYVHFRVSEVVHNEDSLKVKKNSIFGIFNLNHVRKTLMFLFMGGDKTRRRKVWLALFAFWGTCGVRQGEKVVIYLYVRYKFGWNEVNFSMYMIYIFVISVLGVPLWLIICTKVLKVDASVMGAMATTAKILSTFIYAFAPNTMVFCLGIIIEVLNGVSNISLETILSKLAPAEEQGKIAALSEITNVASMFVYGSLYSIVYRSTVHIFPGFFYFLSAAITTYPLGILLWFYKDYKQTKQNLKAAEMIQILQVAAPDNTV